MHRKVLFHTLTETSNKIKERNHHIAIFKTVAVIYLRWLQNYFGGEELQGQIVALKGLRNVFKHFESAISAHQAKEQGEEKKINSSLSVRQGRKCKLQKSIISQLWTLFRLQEVL